MERCVRARCGESSLRGKSSFLGAPSRGWQPCVESGLLISLVLFEISSAVLRCRACDLCEYKCDRCPGDQILLGLD